MSKGSKSSLSRSKSIDHQIDQEREKKQREIQLLVLGGACSGKSTFIKQLRLHYGDGFPEPEREKYRNQVYDNIAYAMNKIIDQMKRLQIPYASEKVQDYATEFQKRNPRSNLKALLKLLPESEEISGTPTKGANCLLATAELTKRFAYVNLKCNGLQTIDQTLLTDIWDDSGVQTCYEQRSKFKEDSLSMGECYFLGHMKRILRDKYIPSLQDILFIRKPTVGVIEHIFRMDNLVYRVIDVAGQKSQRKKWIHLFENVTAVLFFVALSEFDEFLEEDEALNSLQDSLQTFHEVSHNFYLEKTDFILFLNKHDLFIEKLKTTRFQSCMKDYTGENTPEAVVKYIRELFHQHRPCHKQVYTHVSCATDVMMMRELLSKVIDIVTEINLRKSAAAF